AEDVGLLPENSFKEFLKSRRGKVETFPAMATSLWTSMDRGEFSPILERKLLRFNGQLFSNAEALPLTDEQLELLIDASTSDWGDVEPAIFGTLLVPVYWRHYGPANFLWFSDLALLIGLTAVWLESPLLAGMQAVSVGLLELVWIADFLVWLPGDPYA